MKNKELKLAVKELLHQVSGLNVRVTQLEYPPKEEKKELEVGKWYKYQYKCGLKGIDGYLLFNFNGKISEDSQYGFTHTSTGHKFVDDISIYEKDIPKYTEATPQELESALIKEAKRRGFDYDDFVFEDITNILWANYDSDIDGKEEKALFNNGKWAEVIKNDDKFAELKEAHKNGAVIQYEFKGKWVDAAYNDPIWHPYTQYRIKPEEKPKVGDVVRVDYGDDFSIKILRPSDLSSPLFKYTKLTKQEAIDLLWKK